MFFRNFVLALGVLCILGGAALGYLWITSQTAPASPVQPEAAAAPPPPSRVMVLTAAHPIPSGALLQPADAAWKEIGPDEMRPGNLVRGKASEKEIWGAGTGRDFAAGEAFADGDLLILKPGSRAISITLDGAQSSTGLVLPGSHVDVILTQSQGEGGTEAGRKIVAETILQDIRVIGADQTQNQPKGAPRTVTLELTSRQAEMIFVALQLGRLQLSVRSFKDAPTVARKPDKGGAEPTWASDVSPALSQMMPKQQLPAGSSIEGAVRRPPAS